MKLPDWEIKRCGPTQFKSAITDHSGDKFAKTFVAKANMGKYWEECFGLVEDDALKGAIIVTLSKRAPSVANLQLLHTFHAYRGQYVGKRLVEDRFHWVWVHFITTGATYFRVSSEPEAAEFYRKIGFKFWGKQKSGSLLSIFRIGGLQVTDGVYDKDDPVIQKAIYKKGRGGCVEVFDYPE